MDTGKPSRIQLIKALQLASLWRAKPYVKRYEELMKALGDFHIYADRLSRREHSVRPHRLLESSCLIRTLVSRLSVYYYCMVPHWYCIVRVFSSVMTSDSGITGGMGRRRTDRTGRTDPCEAPAGAVTISGLSRAVSVCRRMKAAVIPVRPRVPACAKMKVGNTLQAIETPVPQKSATYDIGSWGYLRSFAGAPNLVSLSTLSTVHREVYRSTFYRQLRTFCTNERT